MYFQTVDLLILYIIYVVVFIVSGSIHLVSLTYLNIQQMI